MSRRVLTFHTIFWIVYSITYAILWSSGEGSFLTRFWLEVCLLPFKLVLTYSVISWLLPQYLFKKKYLPFTFQFVLIILAVAILHQLYTYFIIQPSFHISPTEVWWSADRTLKRLTFLVSPMLVLTTWEVIRNYYEQKELNVRMAAQKTDAELKVLKSQLQPHFFFNTMNSLYTLTLKKSDVAPEMILKLTELMRYSMDQTDNNFIALARELEFIQNYVSIEQLRFGDKVAVNWNLNVTQPEAPVPHLLLMTFAENAFKHGVAQSLNTAVIDIQLSTQGNKLVYTVTNTVPVKKETTAMTKKATVGLSNLRQRLTLLYSDRFTLTNEYQEGLHLATLSIPLK